METRRRFGSDWSGTGSWEWRSAHAAFGLPHGPSLSALAGRDGPAVRAAASDVLGRRRRRAGVASPIATTSPPPPSSSTFAGLLTFPFRGSASALAQSPRPRDSVRVRTHHMTYADTRPHQQPWPDDSSPVPTARSCHHSRSTPPHAAPAPHLPTLERYLTTSNQMLQYRGRPRGGRLPEREDRWPSPRCSILDARQGARWRAWTGMS